MTWLDFCGRFLVGNLIFVVMIVIGLNVENATGWEFRYVVGAIMAMMFKYLFPTFPWSKNDRPF